MTHRINAIRFDSATDGDCECTCGWAGRASDFASHRDASGATRGRKNMPTGAAAKWRLKAS